MFKIDVPATSANLGAGFDTLGIALDLKNTVYMDLADEIIIESNEPGVPKDESNLIYKTAKYLFEKAGEELKGLHIKQEDNIPMTRGLGSSSACIVAGLFGANALLGDRFSIGELAFMAAQLEHHPDNIAPAIYGGIVASVLTEDKLITSKKNLKDDLSFVVIIPNRELETSLARSVIPEKIPHRDAVFNLGRCTLMFDSLAEGNYSQLKYLAEDKLHQTYRMDLIMGARDIIRRSYEFGAYCGFISGAGSSLMTIAPLDNEEYFNKMRDFLRDNGYGAYRILALKPNNLGVVVTKL